MELSFIISLFNRLDVTRPCLESLQATLPRGLDHEIVFIDDGSTDGTREWLATLPSPPFVVLYNEANLGYARSNNRGARAARGRILALVNNDLVFRRGWLPPMLRALRRRRAGIVGNVQYRVHSGELDHAGVVMNINGKPEHLNRAQRRPIPRFGVSERPAVTAACCLISRELFLALGGFDEAYHNGTEDVDLCFRVRHHGRRVLVANRSVIRHHVSASPGRKLRDESNCRRLCRLWRDDCKRLGAAAWPLDYLREHWLEPRNYDDRLLAQAVLRLLGLVRSPAPQALAVVEKNLRREEAHWLKTLGPEDATS